MKHRATIVAVLAGMLCSAGSALPTTPPVYDLLIGGEQDYTVAPGDSIWAITGRFTMNRALFHALNTLSDADRLRPGMRLRVSDRQIVPRRHPDGIVVDLSARTLYWFAGNALKARYPVAVGRLDSATPPGRYRIVGRRPDPTWHVPPSIQREMKERGEEVVAKVPPGPTNPLGKYWIQLSAPGFGLHGTNAPASIGRYASHGCLRLLPEHVERLYHEASNGTPVEIVYEPVKLARDATGSIYLEVHQDVVNARRVDVNEVLARVDAAGLSSAVDVARITEVVLRAWGTPEDVTRHDLPTPATDALIITPAQATDG
jgi:L,D-transpeptidase ErfK/SrfK